MNMLKVNDIVVGYNRKAVAGPLSFEFRDGECVMLRGANGSGKSTLLKTLAGLLKPLSGSFSANGQTVMVPTHIPKVKGFTVREFIRTSFLKGTNIFGKLDKEAEAEVEKAIVALELEPLADKDLSRVSDGEFQKACIATALTRKAGVILLDEPTAFLDVDNRIMVLKTLQGIAHGDFGASTLATVPAASESRFLAGPTVIFSTHDIHDGEKFSDSTLKLTVKQ